MQEIEASTLTRVVEAVNLPAGALDQIPEKAILLGIAMTMLAITSILAWLLCGLFTTG